MNIYKFRQIKKDINALIDTPQKHGIYKANYLVCLDNSGYSDGYVFKSLVNARAYYKLCLLLKYKHKNRIYRLNHKLSFNNNTNSREFTTSIDLRNTIPVK